MRVSGRRAAQGRLRGGLARPENLERRRDPGARRDADRDPHRTAGRSRRHAEPLHRGRGQRRAGRLALCAERQSAARAEIRLQARLDEAARRATPPRSTKAGVPVVLAGDYNVVPTDADIYPTKSYDEDALLQPQSRAAYQRLLAQGWVDAIRTLHPDAPMYTFWDYMRNRWERDAGLRLDQLLLSRRPAQAPGRGRRRPRRARRGRTPAIMRRCGWCCATAASRRQGACTAAKPARANARADVQRSKPAAKTKEPARPLLVIDGDSFAHRAYHALPKTILRAGDKPAGAILGFANFLLRFYQSEAAARRAGRLGHARGRRPIGTKLFPPIRADANSTTRSSSSSTSCRSSSRPAASRTPRRRATRPTISSPPPRRGEERRGGTVLVASGDRDTFQLASDGDHDPLSGARRRGRPHRARRGARALWRRARRRCRTSSRCAAIRPTGCRARRRRPARRRRRAAPARLARGALEAGRFATQAEELRLYRSIATMDRKAPLPRLPDQTADLGEGRRARPHVAAQPARRPLRQDGVALTPPASPTSRATENGR